MLSPTSCLVLFLSQFTLLMRIIWFREHNTIDHHYMGGDLSVVVSVQMENILFLTWLIQHIWYRILHRFRWYNYPFQTKTKNTNKKTNTTSVYFNKMICIVYYSVHFIDENNLITKTQHHWSSSPGRISQC